MLNYSIKANNKKSSRVFQNESTPQLSSITFNTEWSKKHNVSSETQQKHCWKSMNGKNQSMLNRFFWSACEHFQIYDNRRYVTSPMDLLWD